MRKPIIDKAEVSVDLPGRLYHGAFGRESSYDVKIDRQGVHIAVDSAGESPRHARVHLHYFLFAGILDAIADDIGAEDPIPADHVRPLKAAVANLSAALDKIDD